MKKEREYVFSNLGPLRQSFLKDLRNNLDTSMDLNHLKLEINEYLKKKR